VLLLEVGDDLFVAPFSRARLVENREPLRPGFAGFGGYRLIADEWLFARAFLGFHVRFKIDGLAPHALLPITDAVKIFLGSDKKPSPGKSKRGLAFFADRILRENPKFRSSFDHGRLARPDRK
jgi:hypothetical protein